MFRFTKFADVTKPQGTPHEMEWSGFIATLAHVQSPMKRGSCISPVTFKGHYRNTENAIARYAVFGDHEQKVLVDKQTGEIAQIGPPPPSIEAAAARFHAADLAAELVSTHSHKPGQPRYRSFLHCRTPIQYPTKSDERVLFLEVEKQALKLFFASVGMGEGLDVTKLGPDAPFYLPRAVSIEDAVRISVPGNPVDLAPFLEQARSITADRHARQLAAAQEAACRAEQRSQKRQADGLAGSLLEEVRAALPTFEKALADAGFRHFPRLQRWLHPASSSGIPGVSILSGRDGVERYVSHHASDPLNITGTVFGAKAHDIVDFKIFQKHGASADYGRALQALAAELGVLERRDAERKRNMQEQHCHARAANDEQRDDDVEVEDFKDETQDAGPQAGAGPAADVQATTRRTEQIRENIEIGEGQSIDTRTDIVTLTEAVDRFVYQSDGSRVSDRRNPRFETSVGDLNHLLAASTTPVTVTKSIGGHEVTVIVQKPVTHVWLRHENRKTVITRTFRPSHPEFTLDPNNFSAFNSWRPRLRVKNAAPNLAAPFLEHVGVVFGDEAEPFLDWLAHIEQFPGVLPHTAWLNIATRTGLGRNWISSVLVRLWRGNVAANVDLVGLIGSAFNGMLSSKLLAVVDEIREGGAGGSESWRFSERLKSIVTEEMRTINPKYGRQSVEWNCCRWLLFSNHRSALKLTETDRRFNVSICDELPRSPAYYAQLYSTLTQPGFIDAVAAVLGSRDLSRFNPGARAIQNDAKAQVIGLSKNEAQMIAETIVRLWPADLITMPQVRDIMGDDQNENRLGAGTRYALEDAGIRTLDRRARMDGQQLRVMSVRNHAHWSSSPAQELALHIKGKLPDVAPTGPGSEGRWRRYLELLEERAG